MNKEFDLTAYNEIRELTEFTITIKYPEMVAQIAPHFDGEDIADFGKDNLWFL